MSRRAELYRVVRDLKRYLSWQQASGAVGSVAASEQAREAFEAKKEARQKAQIERLTRGFRDESGADQSAQDAPAPKRKASEQQASPQQASPQQADKQNEDAPVADSAPTSFNPFGDKKKKTPETPQTSSGPSSATPWKNGVGSRPTRRFGGSKTSESASKEQAGPSKEAAADKSSSKTEKPSMSANSDDNSPPPVDYDSYYPEASGMEQADSYDPSREPVGATSTTPQKPAKNEATKKAAKPKKDPAKMSKPEKLEFLEKYLGDCKRCGLCESRTNIVFGVGDPEAKLVFVGEAPGYNEDQQGEPFVGKAGQLLDKMIGAMGLEREDVYICNVIKCRPPDNRDPQVDEIKECAPFLRKQLGVIEPTVIVTLGKFASQFITGEQKPIGAMRGTWHEWEGIAVMPTYHPAYLLRSEEQKGKTWSDLQMVMEKLGL